MIGFGLLLHLISPRIIYHDHYIIYTDGHAQYSKEVCIAYVCFYCFMFYDTTLQSAEVVPRSLLPTLVPGWSLFYWPDTWRCSVSMQLQSSTTLGLHSTLVYLQLIIVLSSPVIAITGRAPMFEICKFLL